MGTRHLEPGTEIEVIRTAKGMTGFGVLGDPQIPGRVGVFLARETAVLYRTNPTQGIGARIVNHFKADTAALAS